MIGGVLGSSFVLVPLHVVDLFSLSKALMPLLFESCVSSVDWFLHGIWMLRVCVLDSMKIVSMTDFTSNLSHTSHFVSCIVVGFKTP